MAGGLFTQSPGYEKLLQSDYFVDLSDADALGLRSERAWHGLVGLERSFGPGSSRALRATTSASTASWSAGSKRRRSSPRA